MPLGWRLDGEIRALFHHQIPPLDRQEYVLAPKPWVHNCIGYTSNHMYTSQLLSYLHHDCLYIYIYIYMYYIYIIYIHIYIYSPIPSNISISTTPKMSSSSIGLSKHQSQDSTWWPGRAWEGAPFECCYWPGLVAAIPKKKIWMFEDDPAW